MGADITYINVGGDWLCLCMALDLLRHKIVGGSMSAIQNWQQYSRWR